MATQLQEAREHERLFLMHVSHELRTPLTAIRGHVAALADGIVEGPQEQAAAYDVIGSEAARLERLIGDLLDLAKLEADRFTLRHDEVDLDDLLARCEAAHRESARAGEIDLELRAGEVGAVAGDGDRILQIVSNLVENAVRWTPPAGIVRISAADVGSRRPHRGGRLRAGRARRAPRRRVPAVLLRGPRRHRPRPGDRLRAGRGDGWDAVRRRRAGGWRAVRLRAAAGVGRGRRARSRRSRDGPHDAVAAICS